MSLLLREARLPYTRRTTLISAGKVAIVSGSNTGIGQRTALHLAQTGATVIMACRSKERGENGRYEILRELKRTNPQLVPDIKVRFGKRVVDLRRAKRTDM